MNVLVDTSIWSLPLRRRPGDLNLHERLLVNEWAELVRQGRARIIGLVRQKLLSGIQAHDQFESLRKTVSAFVDEPVDTEDHKAAAQAGNHCRSKGIAVSPVDMLICAVALRSGVSIFTTDPDFEKYARVLTLNLGGKCEGVVEAVRNHVRVDRSASLVAARSNTLLEGGLYSPRGT
jgi:predicted nucleic acid-binding protein